MGLCLSCNQPCNSSSAFCEKCLHSLLEKGKNEKREGEQRPSELAIRHLPEGVALGLATAGQVHVEAAPDQHTEAGERLWDWQMSAPLAMESGPNAVQQAPAGLNVGKIPEPASQPTNVLAVPEEAPASSVIQTVSVPSAEPFLLLTPTWRLTIPRRIRIALIFFCIVATMALLVDAVLFSMSFNRHHTVVVNPTPTMRGTNQVTFTPLPTTGGGAGKTPTTSRHPTSTPDGTTSPASTTAATSVVAGLGLSVSSLAFTTYQNGSAPAAKSVNIFIGNNTGGIFQITSTLPSWLQASAIQGQIPSGSNALVSFSVQPGSLAPKIYSANLTIIAQDNQGRALQNSPQTISITFTILVPCVLQVSPTSMSFNVLLGLTSPQTFTVQESGDCAYPVKWTASSDQSWATVDTTSASDNKGTTDTVTVTVKTNLLALGTYKAQITISATASDGYTLTVVPINITVSNT